MEILNDLKSKNIDLYMDQQAIDTTTPTGSLLFAMIGAFSQFEREMIRERVVSGLDNARKKGRIGGRRWIHISSAIVRFSRKASAGVR